MLRITARLPDPLRNPFSWRSRSRAACATETPRSFTNLTASSLNSRLNFRLCIPTLQFRQTPYLGVHETGSRAELAASLPRHALDVYDHFKGKCPAKLKSAAEIMPKPAAQQGTDGKLMPSGSLVQRDATLPLRHIRQPAHARDLPICQRRQRGSSSCDSMQARLACPWPRTATRRSETWTRHGHWPSAERWVLTKVAMMSIGCRRASPGISLIVRPRRCRDRVARLVPLPPASARRTRASGRAGRDAHRSAGEIFAEVRPGRPACRRSPGPPG